MLSPIDGVAIGSNNINDDQANIIDSPNNKRVIVLPDADSAGMKMVNKAVDRGWGVAFLIGIIVKMPRCLLKYGRLYTLRSILDSVVTNTTKIKVLAKGYCK